MLRPATTLVWPAVLLSVPPSVRSLVLPPALTSTSPEALMSPVPVRVVRLPAVVLMITAPVLVTSSCAASVRTEALVSALSTVPLASTRLTVRAAVWPSVKAVASLKNSPPVPTEALKRATSVSKASLLAPNAPAPLIPALSLSSLANTFTAVSEALSITLPLVLTRLTEPQGVLASDCRVKLAPVRSAAERASSMPTVMLPPACKPMALPVVWNRVPAAMLTVLLASEACTSMVPPAVLTSPAAA